MDTNKLNIVQKLSKKSNALIAKKARMTTF